MKTNFSIIRAFCPETPYDVTVIDFTDIGEWLGATFSATLDMKQFTDSTMGDAGVVGQLIISFDSDRLAALFKLAWNDVATQIENSILNYDHLYKIEELRTDFAITRLWSTTINISE